MRYSKWCRKKHFHTNKLVIFSKKSQKRSKLYSIDLLADEDQVLYVGDRLKKANRTYSSNCVIQWYSVILLSKCD